MNKVLVHIFFLTIISSFFVTAQANIKLEGRVISPANDVSAVHVTNLNTNRSTITDYNGFFTITVRLGDVLGFSAVQFKKKTVQVTEEIMEVSLYVVSLEDALTELDEVVVMPYNLSGDLDRDMRNLAIGEIITASTEGLPNAHLKPITKSERALYAARTWDAHFYVIAFTARLDPLFNYFSGRTKMLNERVARESQSERLENVRTSYKDSMYINDLKLSNTQIDDFLYFCEQDSLFISKVDADDRLALWDFLRRKSNEYHQHNAE